MNAVISNTGFWDGENAHKHHVHSPKLAKWISDLLSGRFNLVEMPKDKRIYDAGCFTAGTQIEAPTGKQFIQNLKVDDKIYDQNYNIVSVVKLFERVAENRVNIYLNTSAIKFELCTTSEHPILGLKRKNLKTLKYKDPKRAGIIFEENNENVFNNPEFINVCDLEEKDLIAISRKRGKEENEKLAKF